MRILLSALLLFFSLSVIGQDKSKKQLSAEKEFCALLDKYSRQFPVQNSYFEGDSVTMTRAFSIDSLGILSQTLEIHSEDGTRTETRQVPIASISGIFNDINVGFTTEGTEVKIFYWESKNPVIEVGHSNLFHVCGFDNYEESLPVVEKLERHLAIIQQYYSGL